MDTLCGIGLPELIIIALIGFVVVGPQRTRDIALTAGRWLRKLMRSAWWKEFNQITAALRDLPTTLVRMAELEDDLRRVQNDLNLASDSPVPTRRVPGEAASSVDLEQDPWGIRADPAEKPSEGSEPPSPAPSTPQDTVPDE